MHIEVTKYYPEQDVYAITIDGVAYHVCINNASGADCVFINDPEIGDENAELTARFERSANNIAHLCIDFYETSELN